MPAQKGRPCTGENHGPHAALLVQVVQGLRQFGQQGPAEGVTLGSPIEDDRAGRCGHVDANQGVGHRETLKECRMTKHECRKNDETSDSSFVIRASLGIRH